MHETATLQSFFSDKGGKIICISDDHSIVRILRFALSSCGIRPDELILPFPDADTAEETLETLHENGIPFAVLLERKLGGKNSTDIVFRIRRLYPEASLILVGSNISRDLATYMFELGVKAIVSKPVSADELINKLTASMTITKEQLFVARVRELIAGANSKEALEVVEKYTAQNPESAVAYCLKGDALLSLGDLQEAIGAYEHAGKISPYYTEPFKRLIAIHKFSNDDKAIELLQKMDRINPFNPDRKIEMAEVYLRKNNTLKASSLVDAGFKQASQEFNTLLGDMAERIHSLLADKVPELAEEYLEKAIAAKKSFTILDLHMFNKLGMLHRNKKEWKKAIEVYKKALEIAPEDPALYYNMALAYHDGGKPDDVLKFIEKATELDPLFYKNNEGASYNLGSMYLEYKNPKLAKPYFAHVLELNPENDKARKKLELCG